ncbi:MAG: rod shape-determining protein RodA [Candidatus Paceibacterota bacterium]
MGYLYSKQKAILNFIDWPLFLSLIPLLGAGLATMYSFTGENLFFEKQLLWIAISLAVFFILSLFDFRFLNNTGVVMGLFSISILTLLFLFLFGSVIKGAQSWFDFGKFSFQPSDPIKLIVIILLAKYFSRRHIEIANIKHIIISGVYAFSIFALVFVQPDFGSAIIIFMIWLGMVLVSGISKKHLLIVFLIIATIFSYMWFFGLEGYQKQRILTFIHPLTDIAGAGYNAYQSTIAIGSGELIGKGLGFGTQSRLQFLPEYETDFVFAAFAEEWGFVGVLIIFLLYGIVIYRIIKISMHGATNFEILFGLGLTILFSSHIIIHIGMNIGLLPITGTTTPFLSYGGSHLLTEFIGLGILMGMRRYSRAIHKDDMHKEFLGMERAENLKI